METKIINVSKFKLKSQQVKTPPTNKFRLKLNQANKFN
jgi:hypothetical protein